MNTVVRKFILIAGCAVFMTSCGPKNERAHPLFKKAEHCVNNSEYQAAVNNYEKYLKVNPDSAVTHYKLAELYSDNLDKPFYAVFHFREFLKLKPNSPDRDIIQTWIEAGEKKFAKKISERDPSSITVKEIEKLQEYNEKYRDYLIKLKNQNAKLRKRLSGVVVLKTSRQINPSNNKTTEVSDHSDVLDESLLTDDIDLDIQQIYTVKQGDSLSQISREVYGSSKHYRIIFNANRDSMTTEASLKIGQKLKIPKLSTEN